MVTARKKIFTVSGIAALIILAVVILIVVLTKKSIPAEEQEIKPETQVDIEKVLQNNLPEIVNIPENSPVKTLTDEEALKNTAKQIGKIFIERYGSYSSESAGQNILEVEEITSKKLWDKISPIIGTESEGEFVGVTTKAIAVDFSAYDGNTAVLQLGVKRTYTNGNSVEDKNERAVLKLIRDQKNTWVVDDLSWQ